MANEEHLEILTKGVEVWNEWRKDNPDIIPDLRRASDANLSRAYLRSADLRGADLRGADLRGASLTDANLSGARLRGTDLSAPRLRRTDLEGADLSGAQLVDADLHRVNLIEANLSGAGIYNTKFIETDLGYADLSGAIIRDTDFTKTYLTGTNFKSAHLSGASFSNIDLSVALGLDRVEHRGPSSIGIDTLYKSGGKIPIEFLRGCGVPEDFITFIPSIIGAREAIQFYSCFISYSTKDEEFARRLYSRMRDVKLRVWFAPEDMKGGKLLHEQIEQAIQLHDRLLVVLSEESMASEWVKREIRNARRAEVRENRRKLFPIRLLDYKAIVNWKGFDGDGGEDLAFELSKFYIPDFSNWKTDHDAFEREFAKLLRDLRAEEKPSLEVLEPGV